MQSALHIKTQVLPGNKIEIQSDNLVMGETVDVFVVMEDKSQKKHHSIKDIINDLPGQEILKTSEEVEQYLKGERESWEN